MNKLAEDGMTKNFFGVPNLIFIDLYNLCDNFSHKIFDF